VTDSIIQNLPGQLAVILVVKKCPDILELDSL